MSDRRRGTEAAEATAAGLDIGTLRRLQAERGPGFWRSLEEVAGAPEFGVYLREEFPRLAPLWELSSDRRGFLKVMAAALALAGLGGCGREPLEAIVPHVKEQPEQTPGKSLYYATAALRDGYATGVLVENAMGRPIKVEGNPNHPASLGGSDIFAQAAVLQLWDPDRAQMLRRGGEISGWDTLMAELSGRMAASARRQGRGLRLLTGTVTSPSLRAQIETLLQAYPEAQWHQYSPVNDDNARHGARMAFGAEVQPLYHFDQADVILALDSDFLALPPGRLRYARDFAGRRRVSDPKVRRNRLYAAESSPTITGAVADNRWRMRAGEVELLARAAAAALGAAIAEAPEPPLQHPAFTALIDDLRAHRGRALIVAGERQPPQVHALAHLMNGLLGNDGRTVTYHEPVASMQPGGQDDALRRLTGDMAAGQVEDLIIVGGNPAYSAPADVEFARALGRVPFSVYLSLYPDETADRVLWHVPQTHTFETWSDARAFDGTATITQPLIAPLYGGRSEHELLAVLNGEPQTSAYEIVQRYWRPRLSPDFDRRWRQALHQGVVEDTAARPVAVKAGAGFAADLPRIPGFESGLELNFMPDPTIWDGAYANLGWLQELPKPLTKLTWDNAALISPATAQRLGIDNREVVELHYRGRALTAPIWITPGHPDGSLTLSLGYGRSRAGRVGTGAGVNAYALRTLDAPWFGYGLEIRKTGRRAALVSAQHHHAMEGRDLVRSTGLDEFRRNPRFARSDPAQIYPQPSLYPEFPYEGYKWAMSVDLSTCIGCAACVVACQAENSIPVVGKDQVSLGREMQWLRIDRYYEGPLDDPRVHFQPVPCMQCEKAPCEPVCPVEASIHDSEGINVQVYNRCIGTRFCSNNCPYKVRRFNFLQYSQDVPALNAQRNPEVTVRMRGVMEKCNYCLQRIANGRIEAEKAGRRIRDGEVVTACQAACPTGAIVFGDLNDPDSRVAALKRSPLDYPLLGELNTVPRTTYLAGVRNPNPDAEEV